MARSGGTFKAGNQAAKGSPGPSKNRPITQAIIAKLNEVDKSTGKAHIYGLVDELFKQAVSRKVKRIVRGKVVELEIPGDLEAIKHIADRAEGKPVQAHSLDEGTGKVTIVFEPGDEKL